MPREQREQLSRADCVKFGAQLASISNGGGYTPVKNRYGSITHSLLYESTTSVIGFSQLFPSGEIWGCDASLLWPHPDNNARRSIPTSDLTKVLMMALTHYRHFGRTQLGYGEHGFKCCIGITGLDQRDRLGISANYFNNKLGPIYDPDIEAWFEEDQATGAIVYQFMTKLFDLVGWEEPPHEVKELCQGRYHGIPGWPDAD